VRHFKSLSDIKWGTLISIGLIHVGVLFAPWTFRWDALLLAIFLYWLTGCLGITLGYHRLFTHNSFRVPKVGRYVLATVGALAGQAGPISWVAAHRRHHRYSDREGDPHSPREGFFWSHMGWLFKRTQLDEYEYYSKDAPDLAKDPYMRFLDRQHGLLILASLVGLYWWGGFSYVIWGGSVRMVFLYHSTWFVNSATHLWGYQTYTKTGDNSRNLWWVALLAFGEGWHNNHHAHQGSARHGLRWYEFDLTYLIIRFFHLLGLAKKVNVPTL